MTSGVGEGQRHTFDGLPVAAPYIHDREPAIHQLFGFGIADQIAQPLARRPAGIIVVHHLDRFAHRPFGPGAVIAGAQGVIEHNHPFCPGRLFDQRFDFSFIGRRALAIVVKVDIGMMVHQLKTFAIEAEFIGKRPGIRDLDRPRFMIAFISADSLARPRRQADRRRAIPDSKGQRGFN